MGFDTGSLPEPTRHATKRAILDGIGVMLAASGESPDVRPFVELHDAKTGPATVLGWGRRASATEAALINGAMAHALDYEDAFDRVPLHPNASLLPAALALAESGARCSGLEFITAVALGCDVVCRLGLSLRRPLESGGWYPPPILGAFGATTAAARLQQLSPSQLCDAFSLLLCQNSCPGEIKFSPESTIRAIREAFPAQAAVLCVALAARGVRGFAEPLEGKAGFYRLFANGEFDAASLFDALGQHFWIDELSFKRWPCCRGTHAYIEALQLLKRDHRFDLAAVESIVCRGGEVQQMLADPEAQKRQPRTVIDAKFSLPFTAAVALAEAEVTLGSFTETSLRDAQLLGLAARCRFERRGDWGRERATAAEVQIRLRDGRILHQVIERALGDPTRPLSDQALREKFIDCAARAAQPLSRPQAERYADRLLSLECESDAAAALTDRP